MPDRGPKVKPDAAVIGPKRENESQALADLTVEEEEAGSSIVFPVLRDLRDPAGSGGANVTTNPATEELK